MNSGNRSKALIAWIGPAIVFFIPLNSEAAAPVYFDLVGLIVYGALYLLGLVVFQFVIGFSKDRAAKQIWSWLFAIYVIGPATYIFVEVKLNASRNARIMNELEVGKHNNLHAFGTYCKDRQRVIHRKPKQERNPSLIVRFEENFTGDRTHFNTGQIFNFIHLEQGRCFEAGLKYMEGTYDGKYLEKERHYEKEFRRYLMCTRDKWEVIAKPHSRYELVLGQTGSVDSHPLAGGGNMSKSSVQIIDRSTGDTLAEDTMYFLRFDTGEAGCPAGLDQLSSLIIEVFGRK